MSKSPIRHQTRRKNSFPYQFAILCSQNPEVVNTMTLPLLRTYRIPIQSITLFVPNIQAVSIFQTYFSPRWQGRIAMGDEVAMASYYPVGAMVVICTDRWKGLYEWDETSPRSSRPLRSLLGVIRRGFLECQKNGSIVWGVMPAKCRLRGKVQKHSKRISASLKGLFNPGMEALQKVSQMPVIRLNFISVVTSPAYP